nr:protein tyrosine phosphatase mitochondrial [Hymenolepis microstoma]
MNSTLAKDLKFYVTLAYGSVVCRLGLRNWYDRINDKIVLGGLPMLPDFDSTRTKENITHVISMIEPHEVKGFVLGPSEAAFRGLKYINLPVQDFVGVPSIEQVDAGLSFIDSCRGTDTSVYIHCKAGRTRSAYIVVCYFMHAFDLNMEKAIEHVRNLRPSIKFNQDQMQGLQDYFDHLSEQKLFEQRRWQV